ncbi:MAG: hypothetical protein U0228_08830 [Myxococcaceae bacterium]
MATRTLALPSWMNVVLEGGGLELERAAVEYVQLRTLLEGDWRPRALEVVALTTSVATREFAVLEAEQRAQRRAALDPEFVPGASLTKVVRERRAALAATLKTPEVELCAALDRVREEAEEASRLARAFRQLHVERTAWTAGLAAMLGAAPLASYIVARQLGGVRFDLSGLIDSPASVLALLLACAAGAIAQARLSAWDWLRGWNGAPATQPPGWTATLALLGVVVVTSVPLTPLAPTVSAGLAFSATLALLGRVVLAWRRAP